MLSLWFAGQVWKEAGAGKCYSTLHSFQQGTAVTGQGADGDSKVVQAYIGPGFTYFLFFRKKTETGWWQGELQAGVSDSKNALFVLQHYSLLQLRCYSE